MRRMVSINEETYQAVRDRYGKVPFDTLIRRYIAGLPPYIHKPKPGRPRKHPKPTTN